MIWHIRYVADLLGPRRVAIGIDNVYFANEHYRKFVKTPERWTGKTALRPPPWNYFRPEDFPKLIDALIEAGFDETDIRGIAGENFLRVAGEGWQ